MDGTENYRAALSHVLYMMEEMLETAETLIRAPDDECEFVKTTFKLCCDMLTTAHDGHSPYAVSADRIDAVNEAFSDVVSNYHRFVDGYQEIPEEFLRAHGAIGT